MKKNSEKVTADNFFDNTISAKSANRKKFTKIFAGVSLATLITCGTVLGAVAITQPFSPTTTTTNTNTTTETPKTGLITPKEDDPVVYTTGGGLEIKWGQLSIASPYYELPLSSGNLAGFPYFTTNDGTTDYTWVIIGRAPDTSVFMSTIETYLFSTWQTNTEGLLYHNNNFGAPEYFQNQHEIATPAGELINSLNPSKGYITDNKLLTNSSEIPSGSVLCWANDVVGTGTANTSSASYYYYASCNKGNKYHSTYVGTLATVMDGYYTDGTLGIANIKDKIKSVSLTTWGYIGRGGDYNYSSWYSGSNTVTSYVFPLATGSSFTYTTYVTASQATLSSNYWFRNGAEGYNRSESSCVSTLHSLKYYMNSSGTVATAYTNATAGYRPAFCLSLA